MDERRPFDVLVLGKHWVHLRFAELSFDDGVFVYWDEGWHGAPGIELDRLDRFDKHGIDVGLRPVHRFSWDGRHKRTLELGHGVVPILPIRLGIRRRFHFLLRNIFFSAPLRPDDFVRF